VVPVLSDHLVAQPFVELLVSGKLATDAHPHLTVALGVGILMDPGHQRRPNALSLRRWIDGDSPDKQIARFAIEPQASDRTPIEERERPAGSFEIRADGLFCFLERAAGWIEPAIFTKRRLSQPVDRRRVGRPAEMDLQPYQFDSMSIKPLRRARRSAQLKTRCARMSVATVVTTSRRRTSASDIVGNIRMACEPSSVRRISSIQ